jgi:hypothetical protein
VIDYIYLGKENYKSFAAISNDAPDLDESFRWTTTLPGVTYALWQVSATGFPAGSTLNPPGLIHQGMSPGSGGTFDLHFSKYFSGAGSGGSGGGLGGLGGFDFPNSIEDLMGGNDPSQQFTPWLPKAFFVRVIPMKGPYYPGVPGAVAGPPSGAVLVIYNPKGGYSQAAALRPGVRGARRWISVVSRGGSRLRRLPGEQHRLAGLQRQRHVPHLYHQGQPGVWLPRRLVRELGQFVRRIQPRGRHGLRHGSRTSPPARSARRSRSGRWSTTAVDFVTDALASVVCVVSATRRKEIGVSVAVNAGLASPAFLRDPRLRQT